MRPAVVVPQRWQLALFFALLATYGYFIQPPGANALSRYDLVRALADDHRLEIDPYHQNTVDKGYFDGHYYSDKAFGLSLAAAPAYASLRAVDRVVGLPTRDEQLTVHFLTFITVGIPAASLALLVARAAGMLGLAPRPALLAGAVLGLGTIAFPFSTLFFGHQPASLAAFGATYLLISSRLAGSTRGGGGRHAVAAGLLAGLAFLIEYPAGIVAVLLMGYLWAFFPSRRQAALFALGVVPSVLAIGGYNLAAFGDVGRLSYVFVNDERFALAHRGLMGVSWPDPTVALDILFGGRGLFINAPVLALAPVGLWHLWRGRRARPEVLLFISLTGAFIAYNAGYYLPFGGWTPGPRFLIPILPFLAVPLAAVFSGGARLRLFAIVLGAWGAVVMFLATATTPLVAETKPFPLLDVWVARFLSGDVAYNLGLRFLGLRGLTSLLPLLVGILLTVVAIPLLARAVPARVSTRPFILTAFAPLFLMACLPPLASLGRGATASADPTFAVEELAPGLLKVSPRQEQDATVTIRNGPTAAHNVALWLAVAEESGKTRHEDWVYPLNLAPGERRRFQFQWLTPADEPPGELRLQATVLHHSWSYDLGRSEQTASFAVVTDGS